MQWLETVLAYLFPSILIDGTPWRDIWVQQQKEHFLRVARFTFPAIAVGYICNFYLFDVPMKLEPIDLWFKFRLTVSLLSLVTFTLYLSPIVNFRFYKAPAIIMCSIICYSQAYVTIFYGKEAWFFFFLFVLATPFILKFNVFHSLLFSFLIVGISLPVLIEGNVSLANIASGALVTLIVLVITRASGLTEVRIFLLNQENDKNQKQMIDMNVEFSERLKSFIPKVIANRLTRLMEDERFTVVEASIEALKAKKKEICCLFTDIRGFTQGSKDLDSFITDSVMPEVSACSDAIEDLNGIPRKVGDLIFAYFDDDSMERNVVRAILSGIEVAKINESMNATSSSVEIKRYILISSGDAMVGNFGGLDSSVEITALGTPVNFLSRVDDLTKAPQLASILKQGDLILSSSVAELLTSKFNIQVLLEDIQLDTLDLQIRDFPEVNVIYRMSDRDEANRILLARLRDLTN